MPHLSKKHGWKKVGLALSLLILNNSCFAYQSPLAASYMEKSLAERLGWIEDINAACGGYYFEEPFIYPDRLSLSNAYVITSQETLFSVHGTSNLKGNIVVKRVGQELKSDQAYLYRDAKTGKLNVIDLEGNVQYREPDSLILGQKAHVELAAKKETLHKIVYRTSIYGNKRPPRGVPDNQKLKKPKKIYQLNAWGKADSFYQDSPKIFQFKNASYTTCPPLAVIWQVKANIINLNKLTGRGTATNARIYLKKIPIFYTPYFNFPLDARRKSGFLYPFFGTHSRSGAYLAAPVYWNIAPNYDATLTPKFLEKRGIQINTLFRYLTPRTNGILALSVLPFDREFQHFQSKSDRQFNASTQSQTQANLRRLMNAGATRGSIQWQNTIQINPNWSSSVNYNYVTDDYYLRDLGHTLEESTENQLLQRANLIYNSDHWNFSALAQGYQTLHPVDINSLFLNQYSLLPRIEIRGSYPDQKFGLNYFIDNEITHFDINHLPGGVAKLPIGNRFNVQPGVSLPLHWPFLYIVPRAQIAMTQYIINNVPNNISKNSSRILPILDINTGIYFDRSLNLFNISMKQTLEPHAYYAFIPYRDQSHIPIFDTKLNTLNYDQLFTYNRFSGLDRLGDTNQLSLGLTSRFINANTGEEKIYAGIGEIIYLDKRKVTTCTASDIDCPDATTLRNNGLGSSPISGVINYHLNPHWSARLNTIWNTQIHAMDNQSAHIQYHDERKILNIGYAFARGGDLQRNLPASSSANNLKQIDFSFAWPMSSQFSVVGRWTQSINQGHFQNLLSGLQYDSCCWALRAVLGKTYRNLSHNNTYQYDTQFYIQIALKGLANVGTGDPTQLISNSVANYTSNFGHEY